MESRFRQVDVFTDLPFRGNPVAVVCSASGMTAEEMQTLARWTNLSETTFLLPPTDPAADYRVRIFTPGGELPFAGHPTLGSAHAWLAEGGRPKDPAVVVQECGVGLIRVHRRGGPSANGALRLAFEAPPVEIETPEESLLVKVAQALGIDRDLIRDARMLDNGPRWLALLLPSAADVIALAPDHAALRSLFKVGVVAPYAPGQGHGCDFEVRAFAAPLGINEDPVTGSLNASLAAWLTSSGLAPAHYVVSQGQCLGRDARVSIERAADGRIFVEGASVTCIEGSIRTSADVTASGA
jgi:PhzF family phenazine biosynthesis protein